MMRRKLIVHIGPHKTGTTAIQNVLRAGTHAHLLYPEVGLWEVDGAHHGLVFNFYQDFSRPDIPRYDVDVMLRELGRQVAESLATEVILSSEELEGRDLVLFVEAVRAALPPAEWETEILFTYRDAFERASSLYNQWVKDGAIALTLTPDEFLGMEKTAFCYRPTVEKLKAAGFRSRLVQYHPASTFVSRFMAGLGVEISDERDSQFVNLSLSPVGLVAMLGLNSLVPNLQTREQAFACLKPQHRMWAPSTEIFNPTTRRETEPLFAADRTYLEREFGVNLTTDVRPTPDSRTETRGLVLGMDDLSWLAGVSQGLGPLREPLLEFAQRFLSPDPSVWKRLTRTLTGLIRPR